MSILFVSYSNSPLVDVLSYREIMRSIDNGKVFYPRMVELPRCVHTRTAASAYRISEKVVEIEWDKSPLNEKGGVCEGTMILKWEKQEDVLIKEPSYVEWQEENSGDLEHYFPSFILLQTLNG